MVLWGLSFPLSNTFFKVLRGLDVKKGLGMPRRVELNNSGPEEVTALVDDELDNAFTSIRLTKITKYTL